MLKVLEDEFSWHCSTAAHLLRIIPVWVLVVPFAAMICFYELDKFPLLSPYLAKKRAEVVGPVIVFLALIYATSLAHNRSHVYFTWQALFALAVFLRELHFWGTNTGFLIALPLLIRWASRHRERLQPYIYDKRIVTLMACVLWTYLVSQIFDWFILDDLIPKATADVLEENLEAFGHLLFFVQVAVSAVMPSNGPSAIE